MAAQELKNTTLFHDANLGAYWQLEDTSDSSAGGHTLTNVGTTPFNPALFNNGADFGAANSSKYLTASNPVISPLSDYTISFWVKLNTEIASGTYELFHLENNTAKHVIYIQYQFNGGTRRLHYQQDKWLVVGYSTDNNVALGTASWHLVTVTMASRVMQLYLDGVAVGTPTTISLTDYTTGNTTTNDNVVLGAATSVGTATIQNYSSAIIDDGVILSRALSAQEIADLFSGADATTTSTTTSTTTTSTSTTTSTTTTSTSTTTTTSTSTTTTSTSTSTTRTTTSTSTTTTSTSTTTTSTSSSTTTTSTSSSTTTSTSTTTTWLYAAEIPATATIPIGNIAEDTEFVELNFTIERKTEQV